MNTNIENKVVLITGASSGIGEATARLLASKSAKVLLGARRTEHEVCRSGHLGGLRLENQDVRVTVITPGVVESELADTISDESAREAMKQFRKIALTPDAIARAIAYAIEQPADVDVNEIIVRPTAGAP